MNTNKTLCLNMIVKDESHIILETLENITSHLEIDYWVICDTGSTDNTCEIIKTFFDKKNIAGEIVMCVWKDFGYNRTVALEAAYNKTDFLFIFDADDAICGDFKLPFKNVNIQPHPVYDDKYMVKIGKGLTYTRPLIVNNRKKWMFRGILHEFLCEQENVSGCSTIEGDYYIDSRRLGNRSNNSKKHINDANLLKSAYFTELKEPVKGLSDRYAFYAARSFDDSGSEFFKDALEWYKIVINNSSQWAQERYYSSYSVGLIYEKQGDFENALLYFLKTVEFDTERIEGIASAMQLCHNRGHHLLTNIIYNKFKDTKFIIKSDKLFNITHLYNDRIEYINSISAYYAQDSVEGYKCCKHILLNNALSDREICRTLLNLCFYTTNINDDPDTLTLFKMVDMLCYKNQYLVLDGFVPWNALFEKNRKILTSYNKDVVEKIKLSTSIYDKTPTYIITITSCRRFDLFCETVNSVMNQVTDITLVQKWFCVDDNSSEEDRTKMKELYPWIEFYMKMPDEKGHRKSMNIIWNKLSEYKPKFWIQLEDDFLFHHKDTYISNATDILTNAGTIGIKQVVFNLNYAETIKSYSVGGAQEISIPGVKKFFLHTHHNQPVDYVNCHYWPHYSLNPSMVDVNAILSLGNYDSVNNFFEMDYATKWYVGGNRTAFFDRIGCKHIGRPLKEANTSLQNAYSLNNELQF